MKINLYISLYTNSELERLNEIYLVTERNLKNTIIDNILILNEGVSSKIFEDPKIQLVPLSNRPSFASFFPFLAEDSINIIANNDIYFDDTLNLLKSLHIKKGDFLALTRRESDVELFRSEIGDSQDVWIFLGKPKVLQTCDFYLGVPGCDNLIAYKFHEAGYRVLNPSKVINCWHSHASQERNYTEANRLKGFYLFIKPTGLIGFHLSRLIYLFQQAISKRIYNIKDLT